MRYDPTKDVGFQLERILQNGLSLQEHFDGGYIEVETTGAEQEIQHNLGRTPIGFLVVSKDGAGDIWSSSMNNWTSNVLFLQSNVASLTARLFVL